MLMLGRKPVSPLCMPYAGIEKATNCILDIPQNIKLEFNDGTVTLKAGSVIVLTGDTYSTITTTQDITWNSSTQANTKQYLFITKYGFAGGLYGRSNLNKADSGPNLPVDGSTYLTFFNTTDKIIYQWNPDNSEWESTTLCYPLGIVEIDSQGHIAGFAKDDNGKDIIFNDFCIIGHHYIGYPNNDLALGCNGFNTDGSYKTTYIHRNALYIFELAKTNVTYFLKPNGTLFGGAWDPNTQLPFLEVDTLPNEFVTQCIYVKDENQVYRWSGSALEYQIQNNSLYYGYINLSSTGIFRSMAIQQPLTKYRWVVKLIP